MESFITLGGVLFNTTDLIIESNLLVTWKMACMVVNFMY